MGDTGEDCWMTIDGTDCPTTWQGKKVYEIEVTATNEAGLTSTDVCSIIVAPGSLVRT